MRKLIPAFAIVACLVWSTSSFASLTTFQTYTGTVGYSTDGWGSTSQSGTISASIPAGATVVAAYLYTSTYFNFDPSGGTLNGTELTYTPLGLTTPCCAVQAWRSDVTSIVSAQVGTADGSIQDFAITEGGAETTSSGTDGAALVVVYNDPTAVLSTVAILDGFSATTGDTATLALADPTDASFEAEMALGIGFSCCNQRSQVTVNGTLITENAGNNDDGEGAISNGQLITVGGFDDPFSPDLPSYEDDHERYDITPYIALGSTDITVDTLNPSNDDNIFLAVFKVTGEADVSTPNDPPPTTVPEPTTLLLTAAGLLGLGLVQRRRLR